MTGKKSESERSGEYSTLCFPDLPEQKKLKKIHFMVGIRGGESVVMYCSKTKSDPENQKWQDTKDEDRCLDCKKILFKIKKESSIISR